MLRIELAISISISIDEEVATMPEEAEDNENWHTRCKAECAAPCAVQRMHSQSLWQKPDAGRHEGHLTLLLRTLQAAVADRQRQQVCFTSREQACTCCLYAAQSLPRPSHETYAGILRLP